VAAVIPLPGSRITALLLFLFFFFLSCLTLRTLLTLSARASDGDFVEVVSMLSSASTFSAEVIPPRSLDGDGGLFGGLAFASLC